MINVGIVGAGLIGTKRAKVISEDTNSQLTAVSDINIEKAKALEKYCKIKDNGCQFKVYQDWQKMLADDNIDVIIASTPNCLLAPVTIAAAESGKHVLSEKPLGRNPEEASKMVEASEKNNVLLRVGFNHRYHPAYRKLVDFYQKGEIGDIYFIRARYGHGARPGFEKEWRANPEIAGGGELLDQGVHIIDLARNLMGCFTEVFGFVSTFDWNINPLEDNGFALLKNSEGKVFSMHASWTQWNNLFCFEVYGSKGFLKMEGLGRSYGTETLRIGWRKPESGPPDEDLLVFNGTDQSFKLEWQDFIKSIITGSPNKVTGNDGLQAVRLVYAIYESSKTGRKVTGKW